MTQTFHGNARDFLPPPLPGHVWLLRQGQADLFLVAKTLGHEITLLEVLCTVEQGSLLLPTALPDFNLEVVPLPNSTAELVPTGTLSADDWEDALSQWWAPMGAALTQFGLLQDNIVAFVDDSSHGEQRDIPAQSAISARMGLYWVQGSRHALQPLGRDFDDGLPVPMMPHLWSQTPQDNSLVVVPMDQVMQRGMLDRSVQAMTGLIATIARDLRQQDRAQTQQRLQDRKAQEEGVLDHLVSAAVESLDGRRLFKKTKDTATPLVKACAKVAKWNGISFSDTAADPDEGTLAHRLQRLAMSHRFQVRRIVLEDNWWQGDRPALLAFRRDNGAPIALVPDRKLGLLVFDAENPKGKPFTETDAAGLSAHAYTFHPGMPEQAKSLMDLARFGLLNRDAGLHHLVLMVLATSLLGVIPPMVMKVLFGSAISSADYPLILELALALVLIQATSITVTMAYESALVRLEGKTLALLQAALFDRVLRQPASFLQKMPLGKIHSKWMIFEKLHGSAVCRLFITTSLTAILSICSLVIMFYFFALPSLLVLTMTGMLLFLAGKTGPWQMQAMSKGSFLEGHYWSIVTEALRGIRKLRLSGGEGRVFSRWFEFLIERRVRFLQGLGPRNRLSMTMAIYEGTALLIVLITVSFQYDVHALDMGHFMAFLAASNTFTHAVALFAAALPDFYMTLTDDLPDAVTFLMGDVENPAQNSSPGLLQGGVELSKLTFRYDGAPRPALDAITIEAKKGEFIALAGPSGCGKSTVLKLLLGMEQPSSGAVFYDGRNLKHLDVIAVRSQIGVVMQSSSLIPGTIFDYIAGGRPITLGQAWDAARLAGVDDVITALPMGMFTIIPENGASLSGGEMQRLMIARAISGNPKVLLFDEATSWLDNTTQQKIVDALSRLRITRIIIAHRLSTLQMADRIYVLDKGQVVETGSFDDLRDADGVFAQLMHRQMA